MRPLLDRAAHALAAMLALVLWTGSAAAHAVLLASDPPADSALARAPASIVLDFNEPVEPVFVRILDARTGAVVATPDPVADGGGRLTAPILELSDGRWLVNWRVVSQDSHPIAGGFVFTVGANPSLGQETAFADTGREAALKWLAGASRAVFLGLLLTAAGGALALVALAPALPERVRRDGSRVLTGVAAACAAAALAFVPAQGALVLGGFDSGSVVAAGFATPLGRASLVAGLLSLGLALLLRCDKAELRMRVVLAATGVAASTTLVLAGHAATAAPRALAIPAIGLHGLAAGFWLGGLVVLSAFARTADDLDLAGVLTAFSCRAVPAVAVLVVAGGTLAILQTRDPAALLSTPWSVVLLAKVALVGLALLLAAQNKLRLTAEIARGEPDARRRLRRNLAVEIAIVVGVLALTAALGQTTPPRALAAPAEPAASRTFTAHDHRHRAATLVVSPLRTGRYALAVSLTGDDSAPATPVEATLAASLPEAGIEPVTRAMTIDGATARLETGDLAVPGLWRVEIGLRLDSFDAARVVFDVALPPP